MIGAREWCERALTAVFSLWDGKNHHAWRTSKHIDSKNAYYPTATFHAIAALGECGVWDKNSKYKNGVLRTPYLVANGVSSYSKSKDVLYALVNQSGPTKSSGRASRDSLWVDVLLNQSSHSQHTERPTFQQCLVLSGLFQALRVLVSSGALDTSTNSRKDAIIKARITSGLRTATRHLLRLVKKEGRIVTEAWLSKNEEVSPNLLLHMAIAIHEREGLIRELARRGIASRSQRVSADIEK